jgi:hypothetical protein
LDLLVVCCLDLDLGSSIEIEAGARLEDDDHVLLQQAKPKPKTDVNNNHPTSQIATLEIGY